MATSDRDQVDIYLDSVDHGEARHVGVLARQGAGERAVLSFNYQPQWLGSRRGISLDPGLGLFEGEQFLTELPGILQDASPDRWGRTLMERREVLMARREGRPVRTLDAWDFLLGVDDATRQGALRLTRDGGKSFIARSELPVPPVTRLRELEELARRHEADDLGDRESEERWLEVLVEPGSSLGGARPKASFRDLDGGLWLAKFPSQNDRRDIGRWEYLLNELAAAAGISVPEARLIQLRPGHATFCCRRFDREEHGRRRFYASAMTLTGRTDGEPAGYLDIVQAIESYCPSKDIARDLEQLFRRLAFNVMVGNRDDHLRNHGFIRDREGWRLSPAFDINPEPSRQTHSLAIDDQSHAGDLATVLATAPFYRLTPQRAETIINEITTVVTDWRKQAKRHGIGADEIALTAPAFSL